jgi:hypothetical protein
MSTASLKSPETLKSSLKKKTSEPTKCTSHTTSTTTRQDCGWRGTTLTDCLWHQNKYLRTFTKSTTMRRWLKRRCRIWTAGCWRFIHASTRMCWKGSSTNRSRKEER